MLWATAGGMGDVVFVRSGTLEENEKCTPDAHFFTRSKHRWITIPEGVPSFETLPVAADGPFFTGEAKARMDAVRNASS